MEELQQGSPDSSSIGAVELLLLDSAGSSEGTSFAEAAVDVDAFIADLAKCQQDPNATVSLLQQLSSQSIPVYSIISSDAWPQLVQLLPALLTSISSEVAAAAECLLLQQLAPELLGCSPEPLAHLLTALLTASFQQFGSGNEALLPLPSTARWAGDDNAPEGTEQKAKAADATAPPCLQEGCTNTDDAAAAVHINRYALAQPTYSASLVQLVLVGLHKLGRQWHFLDQGLAEQLCSAIVDMLAQPFAGSSVRIAPIRQQQEEASSCTQQQQQEQSNLQQPETLQQLHGQQQPVQERQDIEQPAAKDQLCLAALLLLADPFMGWWHRLNANRSSGPMLQQAAGKGLCYVLLQQVHSVSPFSKKQQQQEAPVSLAAASKQLQQCLVTHLLTAFIAGSSGRQLLVAAAAAAAASERQDEGEQQQQQADNGSGSVAAGSSLPVLAAVLDYLAMVPRQLLQDVGHSHVAAAAQNVTKHLFALLMQQNDKLVLELLRYSPVVMGRQL